MKAWPAKFRVAYCERLGCPDLRYPIQVLDECLYPQARMLGWLIRFFQPGFFRPDLDLIQRLGEADSWLAFQAELDGFAQDNLMRGGWLRNALRFRLSGKRVSELAEYLFGPEQPEVRPLARALPRDPAEDHASPPS